MFLNNTYYRNPSEWLDVGHVILRFNKVNLRRFDGKFPHTLPLQKANRQGFMKMQPFNQQKPTPFKVEHGRWGLKGHLSSPRQPPKKSILLDKQKGGGGDKQANSW